MSGDPHLGLGESLTRFLSHWLAAILARHPVIRRR